MDENVWNFSFISVLVYGKPGYRVEPETSIGGKRELAQDTALTFLRDGYFNALEYTVETS